jgi:hypothetical protein
MCSTNRSALASVVGFGSAITGGWEEGTSDVDLIVIFADAATADDKHLVRQSIERLEKLHGIGHHSMEMTGFLERLVNRITGNVGSFFTCTRADLLSGSIGRILSLARAQELFVDRVVLANIVASGVTVWGEDLLSRVPVAPIRRLDVFKAFFGLFGQALAAVALFPVSYHATRNAMEAVKRSVHNCFFCYQQRRGSLEEEAGFFITLIGPNRTLMELLALRRDYRQSFAFVLRCLPTLIRLHYRTFIDKPFAR